jgi:hypothetical protein
VVNRSTRDNNSDICIEKITKLTIIYNFLLY